MAPTARSRKPALRTLIPVSEAFTSKPIDLRVMRAEELANLTAHARVADIAACILPTTPSQHRARLARERIWLDVFDDKARGRQVYEKPGYRRFDRRSRGERRLDFFHEELPS